MSAASSTGLFVLNPDVEIISVREFPMAAEVILKINK